MVLNGKQTVYPEALYSFMVHIQGGTLISFTSKVETMQNAKISKKIARLTSIDALVIVQMFHLILDQFISR